MESELKKCPNCEKEKIDHEYQDKKYGKYIRLMNVIGKEKSSGFRCTVCGAKLK